ncbi:MAG: YfbR-like 5'-deoxynucleotidase [Candidatus Woesearchaeota archaeon]
MDFAPIILEGFEGREEALAQIKRYVHEITHTMFYRTNDLIHSRRVLWHLEEALPKILGVYGNGFDVGFGRTLALVHDDLEILTGDVQLHDKEHMNTEELEALAREEKKAIPKLVKRYNPIANGYGYEELLLAAKEKSRLEAQFVSFFDKFDGGGEAWHEVWAGNLCFLRPAGGNEGKSGGYVRRLNDFPKKYLIMAKFFEQFPEYLPGPFDFREVAEQSMPHTEISLQKDSGYPPYERWKRTVIKHEEIDLLVTQVERP